MSESYTASFHNGGMEEDGIDTKGRKHKKIRQACREHNIRDPVYYDKQDHIVKGGHFKIWIDVPPENAYDKYFKESFEAYNGKQTKKARKFDSYYEKVKKSKILVPVREALITVGDCEVMPDEETVRQIYKDFVKQFQEQNPQHESNRCLLS